MSSKYALNPHALVRFLEKDAKDFTKDDIIRYVTENEIEMINFRYPGADGRLKTLNFIINSLDHLDNILTCGERVDGSSLFPYIHYRYQIRHFPLQAEYWMYHLQHLASVPHSNPYPVR